MYKPRFTIVIPSYLRTRTLETALLAIARQTILPDEVIVVTRNSDIETKIFLENYKLRGVLNILHLEVSEPGYLPPIIAAFATVKADYVGLIDDDVILPGNWVENAIRLFRESDPGIGAITGAAVNKMKVEGSVFPARLSWFGRFSIINDKKKETCKINAVAEADCVFRGEALLSFNIDKNLNRGRLALHGLDIGLQMAKRGWYLKYEPGLNAEHLALQPTSKVCDAENVLTYIKNLAHIIRKNKGYIPLVLFAAYNLFVGQYLIPGLLYFGARRNIKWSYVRRAQRALISELLVGQ